ncbi:MAG TPA: hypothetical protein VGR62_19800 [Candidatus Binatia bacterium]|jgi:hypothetical protein|nr:hypothetical protein [Candidatus Binatia bacterium]
MSEAEVPVAVVVVASRGDAKLERTLAAVAWADERVVLDPLGRVEVGRLPAGVEHVLSVAALATVGRAPWVMLLREDEILPPEMRDAVAAAMAVGEPRRVRRELHVLGITLLLRRAPLRLAPRAGSRVVVSRGLELSLRVSRGVPNLEPLDPVVVVALASSLAAALDVLDADSSMAAALLEAAGSRPRFRELLLSPCVAMLRVLVAHARRPAGLARWVTAVLLGYRAVAAQAKLWERVRNRPLEIA